MTTTVDKSIEVSVPARLAYDQWTQFEEFPQFMGGVREVTQLDDKTIHWVAEIGGVRREWDATVLEQNPDRKIAWTAVSGATNAGAVYFSSLSPERTMVRLVLEYEPEGIVETVGDKLDLVERQTERDLEAFKHFIEDRGVPSGAWRGSIPGDVGTPDTTTSPTRGDRGKAGVSGKAVAAGAAAVAAAAGAVAASRTGRDKSPETEADSLEEEQLVVVVEEGDDEAIRSAAAVWSADVDDSIALEATKPSDPDA